MTNQAKLPVYIRWMIKMDMEQVVQIEQDCFFENHWSEKDFTDVLRKRNCIGMVATRKVPGVQMGEVCGYMVYELNKKYLHILNFAVHPSRQRRGVARQMMKKLQDKLCEDRRSKLVLEVCDNNIDAQLFFKACGFRCVGVERNFYQNCNELRDAYRMEYDITVCSDCPDLRNAKVSIQ